MRNVLKLKKNLNKIKLMHKGLFECMKFLGNKLEFDAFVESAFTYIHGTNLQQDFISSNAFSFL